MKFPFENCAVSAETFSVFQARKLLEYQHGMTYILLDLQRFQDEMQNFTEKNVVAQYLSSLEQVYLNKLTSGKRKREWLGGRFAAKYAAAGVLAATGNALPWSDLAVIADENGRPFLAAENKIGALPDISISHSGDLAAAMAVNKGLCGIDIQKVTDRVVKVRERFCTPDEEYIVQLFFKGRCESQSAVLTTLWAAKESLRKVANTGSLPGFLALQLAEIDEGPSPAGHAPWRFIFTWKQIGVNGKLVHEKCRVAVNLIADYALALTTRNDTVS
jgi:phosphopantetheinyl transferase